MFFIPLSFIFPTFPEHLGRTICLCLNRKRTIAQELFLQKYVVGVTLSAFYLLQDVIKTILLLDKRFIKVTAIIALPS